MKLHKIVDKKDLLYLYVSADAQTPYNYTSEGVTEAYIHNVNESVVADAIELKRLVMCGRSSFYDSLMSPYNY